MARESDRSGEPLRSASSGSVSDAPTRTAFVLSGGGNQAVAQVGMLRALLERDIVPDVIVGTLGGRVQRRRSSRPRRASRGVERLEATWESLRGDEVFPGGRLSRAWNLLTRDDHLFSNQGLRAIFLRGRHPRHVRGARDPAAGGGRRPRHRRGGRVRRGPARSPPCWPAPPSRASSPRSATTAAPWSTARSSTPCPLWHALAGPVDRIYVLNVAGDLLDRPLRSPIDVAVRAFAISRKQRFELELRSVPESVEVVVLPAPVDDRELFDFSGARGAHRRGPRARRRRRSTTPTRRADSAASSAAPGGAATPAESLRPVH